MLCGCLEDVMVGKELAFSGVLQRDQAQPDVQLGLGPELQCLMYGEHCDLCRGGPPAPWGRGSLCAPR